jgi:dienelactone hydrolase
MSAAPAIPELADVELPAEPGGGRFLTGLGIALDSTVLAAMRRAVDLTLMPSPEELPALLASAELMLEPRLQREPRRFFEFPDELLRPLEVRAGRMRRLAGGVAVSREFVYRYAAHGASDGESLETLHVEHWMHRPAHPRATVVAVHGFTMGQPRLDAFVLFARHWFRRGLDVALVTLPHHGVRTPSDSRFSGERFAVPHVARLSEAVRQAIFELRLLTLWLRQDVGGPVGLLGISLGGYLSSLAAGLYDDLDFAVPMVPPVCIGDLAWRFFQRSRHYRRGATPAFSQAELRALYRIHSPLAHPLRTGRERVMIVAGRGDRIVPPEHPHALWLHWGRPRIHWYSGSHLAPFGRGRIVAAIDAHLRAIDVL